MTDDELLWKAWQSNFRLTESDLAALSETERLREEAEKIEQRVSRPTNRISPQKS